MTVVEREERILKEFDPDLVDSLTDHMRSHGISFQLGHDVSAIRSSDGSSSKGELAVDIEKDGETRTIAADMVVHGLGRSANVDTLNLDAVGVRSGKNGIAIDDRCLTTADNIWAIGDCADSGRPMLTPVANDEARAVANQLRGRDNVRVDDGPVPFSAYTLPQIAAVGMSEEKAREEYGDGLTVRCEEMHEWTTYRKVGAEVARYKTLLAPDGRLVGAHLLAPHASETINLLAMAVRFRLTRSDLKQMIFAYPTLSSEVRAMVG